MKKHSVVVINLRGPREKFWGVLLGLDQSGITVLGIDVSSFDDWCRAVARGEASMGLSTVFFPMHRVEKLLLDETVGEIPSLCQLFESRVGQDLWSFLELEPPEG